MAFFSLNQAPLFADDFSMLTLGTSWSQDTVRDAIIVYNPIDAIVESPFLLRSRKTLAEHIAFIQEKQIKKVITVAEDIQFLRQCPSIEYLWVLPSMTATSFDFSPIYDLPNLKWFQCRTTYGPDDNLVAEIDYGRMPQLERLHIKGVNGHQNVTAAENVSALIFDFGYPAEKTLRNTFPAKSLVSFYLAQAPITSLDGIEDAVNLRRLELSYNRWLSDISALAHLRDTLGYLEIDTCGRIHDFSVLAELHNLEYLFLKGSNEIPNLSFLKNMPKLKSLILQMNVLDGDLSLCEKLPSIWIRNRRHYSHKNIDFPHYRPPRFHPDEDYPFYQD